MGLTGWLVGAVVLGACGSEPSAPPAPGPITIPAVGGAATFEAATWNVEWFGHPFGPADDAAQLRHVAAAVDGLEVDLWALQEIVGADAWQTLLAALPDYDGVLSSDPAVAGGAARYDAGEQKLALLFSPDVVTVLGARVILTDEDHAFAGRPPLEVEARVTLGDATEEIVVVVLHMKAGAAAEDRARRETAAAALKAYLDSAWPEARVLVLGDFNDDVDTSIVAGQTTPFAPFIADSADWSFPTAELSAAGLSSSTRYPDGVDHQLFSTEAMAAYVPGSARVIRLDTWIPDYAETTSDHFPVVTFRTP